MNNFLFVQQSVHEATAFETWFSCMAPLVKSQLLGRYLHRLPTTEQNHEHREKYIPIKQMAISDYD